MDIPEKKKSEKSNKYVKRVLYDNIVSFHIAPGTRLEEADLCAKLKVSRTPIREAMLELAQLRLVDIYPQKGTYVSLLNTSLIEQGQYLRMTLEPNLAAMTCESKNSAFLQKQRENLVLLEYYGNKDIDRSLQLDQEFHRRFYYINNMEYLYEMTLSMTTHLNRMRRLCMMTQDLSVTIKAHEEVLRAVEAGNPVITHAAMEDHLRYTLVDLQKVKQSYPEYFQ
ncbi:MAG: GntR family transcriptional regulator [Oscillospiraceae bacterium]|nr:GntR family transcriptional regulator [Oscillospiraceae bacterium]